ncbi:MmgE/PrpD family protein [Domibacillus epiphyticus]|uniref:2-methylcitrate dehydratase n=1 Tax=Domibacillus epiphyticus TaxID=1714355 RepID=A0A1V2A4V6_9BACI|nr:MmgE/PrpD family protein [Domibacillus epiphyticus]OMP65967.1 hypothetical protein BTO28_14330 [Domibacillus epiphyticus]
MVTQTLSSYITASSYEKIGEKAIYEAKRSLLNWLGVAIGGSQHESVKKVLAVSQVIGSSPQASVLGRTEKVDMLFAALLNGLSSHVDDFDDTLLETVLHPSAPVYPAVLSFAEYQKKSGKDVLEAFIVGTEAAARVALSVYPSHYWKGWHITGSVGGIGAAAAISTMMRLNVEETLFAIGIAATDPTGLREMFGTMTKPYHPGKAAMNGMLAALMAAQGFTSSTKSLEAERGFVKALSNEESFEMITKKWGETYEIEKNSYKPFASGVVTHPAIDGIISIQKKYQLLPQQVEWIEITGHPLVEELTGKKIITTGLEGKFSVYHCVAAAFFQLKAGIHEFTDDCVNDSCIKGLREKVRLVINETYREDQAQVKVKLYDGREYIHTVDHAIGSQQNPMTDQQLQDKFIDVTGSIINTEKKRRLIDLIAHLDEVDDLAEFFALCCPVFTENHS